MLAIFCILSLLFSFSACDRSAGAASASLFTDVTEDDSRTEAPSESETVKVASKRIAFTFDDGPHPVYTRKIVDLAAELGGKVTFFVVGTMLLNEDSAAAFSYALDSGCEVGIHCFSHLVNFDECDDETYLFEISRTADIAKGISQGFEPTLMRPVGGRITEERVKESPYAVVKWNIDTKDYLRKGAATEEERDENVDAIVSEILSKASDGSIILMHDLYENTLLAFSRAARALVEEGYELVTVTELLGEDVEAGKVFSKGKPIAALTQGNQN